MKRFISLSIAVLLGLVSATTEVTQDNLFLADTSTTIKTEVTEAHKNIKKLYCLLYDDLTVFDLRSLEKSDPYVVKSTPSLKDYTLNFCKPLSVKQGDKTVDTLAYTTKGLAGQSDEVRLTGTGSIAYTETVRSQEEDGDKTHILYRYNAGEKCGNDEVYQVTTEVFCDPEITGEPTITVDDTNACTPKITLTHKTGCPVFEATSIVRFMANHPYIMGILLLFFGGVVTFYGGKFFPWVLSTAVAGITFLVVLLLASVLGALKALDKSREPTGGQIASTVIAFILAIALAVFAGWFINKIRRIGFTLLGATGGFFGGFLFYSLVFIKWLENTYVLFTICFLSALAGGYLVWKFGKHIVVYVTAFLGAYAFVRGISIWAGHFPNEVALYGQISSGTFSGLEPEFYGYLAGIAVLGVLGCVHQFKKGYHQQADADEDYQKL